MSGRRFCISKYISTVIKWLTVLGLHWDHAFHVLHDSKKRGRSWTSWNLLFICHYVLIRSQYALLRFVKLCYAVNTRSTTIAITLPQVLLRLPRSVLTLRHVLLSSVKFSHVHQVLLSSTTFHKHDWSTIAKIGA